jgi:hypothetical protein
MHTLQNYRFWNSQKDKDKDSLKVVHFHYGLDKGFSSW